MDVGRQDLRLLVPGGMAQQLGLGLGVLPEYPYRRLETPQLRLYIRRRGCGVGKALFL